MRDKVVKSGTKRKKGIVPLFGVGLSECLWDTSAGLAVDFILDHCSLRGHYLV